MQFDRKDVVFVEKFGSHDKEIVYVRQHDSEDVIAVSKKKSITRSVIFILKEFFIKVFLPQGYPSSVSADYTRYQIWDTIQAFCSTITGTLSTHAIMKGVGVGNSEATPLAATVTWVLKDTSGHIGRITFAWWKGTSLDANSKSWRLFADIVNDAAICFELVIPYFQGFTIYILCASTVMKSIVGVAGGATRAALTQHQAVRGNLADVAAKDGSQETAVNLVASLVSIFIISVLGKFVWPIFILFTFLHLYANYKAVSSVCLNTFNSLRFVICLWHYMNTGKVLPPRAANMSEPVLFFDEDICEESLCGYEIKLGTSLQSLTCNLRMKDIEMAKEISVNGKYLLIPDNKAEIIYVVLEENVKSPEVLQAYFHALCLGIILNDSKPNVRQDTTSLIDRFALRMCRLLKMTLDPVEQDRFIKDFKKSLVKDSWHDFLGKAAESGWNMKTNLLISDEWRGRWVKKEN